VCDITTRAYRFLTEEEKRLRVRTDQAGVEHSYLQYSALSFNTHHLLYFFGGTVVSILAILDKILPLQEPLLKETTRTESDAARLQEVNSRRSCLGWLIPACCSLNLKR
jgi:hypothetical protein